MMDYKRCFYYLPLEYERLLSVNELFENLSLEDKCNHCAENISNKYPWNARYPFCGGCGEQIMGFKFHQYCVDIIQNPMSGYAAPQVRFSTNMLMCKHCGHLPITFKNIENPNNPNEFNNQHIK